MFLLVPYAVDVPFDRKPFVNWLLVISIIVAFMFEIMAISSGDETAVDPFVLDGWNLQGMVGHLWLHAGILHLGGNMLFLWVFGNAVCAKVGNLKYLPIYLGVGLMAAAAHLLFTGGKAVGASGAINGIVGMFLIFFWQNEMDCFLLVWLFIRPYVKTFSVASYWMILLWLVFDIAGAAIGGGSVAYFAHLGGFVAGALLAIALLKLKWVTMYRDEESLVCSFDNWRQGRQDAKLVKIARDAVDKVQQQGEVETPSPVMGKNSPATVEVPAAIPEAILVEPAQKATPAELPAAPTVLRFACSCGKPIKVPITQAGRKGRCPQCRQVITIPIPTAKKL